ncbi:hypothetical protein MTO96_003504 [Rhipicephalus appendiculatus]
MHSRLRRHAREVQGFRPGKEILVMVCFDANKFPHWPLSGAPPRKRRNTSTSAKIAGCQRPPHAPANPPAMPPPRTSVLEGAASPLARI